MTGCMYGLLSCTYIKSFLSVAVYFCNRLATDRHAAVRTLPWLEQSCVSVKKETNANVDQRSTHTPPSWINMVTQHSSQA